MLPLPPEDLAAFPKRTIPTDHSYTRIHDQWHEPEWFCSDGRCRFDPPYGAVFGTCYVAADPLGAFIERFGRLQGVPRRFLEEKVLSNLRLPSPLVIADATDRQLLGHFGLTAELWAGGDYNGSKQWAAALHQAGFGGIWYPCRHDILGDLHALALFGKSGVQPEQIIATGEPQPIPTSLVQRAGEKFGIHVLASG